MKKILIICEQYLGRHDVIVEVLKRAYPNAEITIQKPEDVKTGLELCSFWIDECAAIKNVTPHTK